MSTEAGSTLWVAIKNKRKGQRSMPNMKQVKNWTAASMRRQKAVDFAGFLTDESEESIYVADKQGTWIIPREGVTFIEEWHNPPRNYMEYGKPVHVGIKEDATIYELRPWTIKKEPGGLGGNEVKQNMDKIFSIGGAPLPVSEQTFIGESQVAELERMFSRRLGWVPEDLADDPRLNPVGQVSQTVSKTIVLDDGYCDTD